MSVRGGRGGGLFPGRGGLVLVGSSTPSSVDILACSMTGDDFGRMGGGGLISALLLVVDSLITVYVSRSLSLSCSGFLRLGMGGGGLISALPLVMVVMDSSITVYVSCSPSLSCSGFLRVGKGVVYLPPY